MLSLIMMEVLSWMSKSVEGVGLNSSCKANDKGEMEFVFHVFCLQMIHSCFVMQTWSKFFIYECFFYVFKLSLA